MTNFILGFIVAVGLISPTYVFADVVINEIAWMGTDDNGSCEWIELYNESEDIVDLSTWSITVLNKSGSTKTVSLGAGAGTTVNYSGIAGRGYYLLSHDTTAASVSCESSVIGEASDWLGNIGSIANDGARISLAQSGVEKDSVDARTGWTQSGIGGSNTVPKKTAQRVGSGWGTHAPTPRGPNHQEPLEEIPDHELPDETATSTAVVTIGGTAPLVPVLHPVPKIYFAPVVSRIVPVGADTTYETFVYDSTGELRTGASVTWSFGDGTREEGEEVSHAYREEGVYTAVVRGQVKGATIVQPFTVEAVRMDVVVEPHARGVLVHNTSPYLLDVSRWQVAEQGRTYTLPEDTVIAAGGSFVLSEEVSGLPISSAPTLLYPNKRVAAQHTNSEEGSGIEETLSSRTVSLDAVRPIPPQR